MNPPAPQRVRVRAAIFVALVFIFLAVAEAAHCDWLVVRDGLTGAPVAATVSAGRIEAAGYLPREQAGAGDVFLWPETEDYVRAMVYHEWVAGRLTRRDGAIVISGPDTPAVRGAVAEIALWTGLAVGFGLSGNMTITVDPTDPCVQSAVACTYLTVRGPVILSSRTVFARAEDIEGGPYGNTVLHELGHALGLGHSARDGDVMQPRRPYRERHFGPSEGAALWMANRYRRPGNLPPDREPLLGALAEVSREVVIRCNQ